MWSYVGTVLSVERETNASGGVLFIKRGKVNYYHYPPFCVVIGRDRSLTGRMLIYSITIITVVGEAQRINIQRTARKLC